MADEGGGGAGGGNPSIMATLASWKAGRAKLRTEGASGGVVDVVTGAAAAGGGGAAPVTASARPAKAARVGPSGARARSTPPPPPAGAAAAAAGGAASPGAANAANAPPPPVVIAPLAKQVKDALNILRAAEGRPMTADEMRAVGLPASYDLTPGGRLHSELVRQPRVAQTTRPAAASSSSASSSAVVVRLAYRSEHGIRDADALLRHIRARPAGTKANDVKDAYRAVLDDADALVKKGLALRQYSYEHGCDVYFPADVRASRMAAAAVAAGGAAAAAGTAAAAAAAGTPALLPLAPEVLRMFHEIEVPTEPAELTAALRRAGFPSALATLQRRKVPPLERAQGNRKRKATAPRNVTNAHLPELFRGAQPDAIDKR